MTTKGTALAPTAADTRRAEALELVREGVRVGFIPGPIARKQGRAFGVEGSCEFYTYPDDHRLNGLIREAGRAQGFGSAPVDAEIRKLLDGVYGKNQWQHDRAPHDWEEGGDRTIDDKYFVSKGKKSRDELFADREAARAKLAQAEAAAETARLKVRDARRAGLNVSEAAAATRELDEAVKLYERAYDEACTTRAAVTTRQLQIQDRYRYEQQVSQ